MQDLSRITATEAVKLIRDGHIEPMEIMEACLDRIDQREGYGRTCAAGADQQRALAGGIAAMSARRADEAEAVDDVAMPAALGPPAHDIDRA